MSPRKKKRSWQPISKEQTTPEPSKQEQTGDVTPVETDMRIWDLLAGAIIVAILVTVAFAIGC